MQVIRFEREEFLRDRFVYQPGEHLSVIEPTQGGKTTLLFQLLATEPETEFPPVMLVAKPADPVVSNGLRNLDYRTIDTWPPPWSPFSKPAGYALWPKHLKNVAPKKNHEHLARIFEKCLADRFWKGGSIIVADEIYFHCVVLGLQANVTDWWTQSSGMGGALWSATQKPSGTQQGTIPTFMYSAPVHTFLGRDPDKRNRDRFGEIGGADPKLIGEQTLALQPYEKLYLKDHGRSMCIVGA